MTITMCDVLAISEVCLAGLPLLLKDTKEREATMKAYMSRRDHKLPSSYVALIPSTSSLIAGRKVFLGRS